MVESKISEEDYTKIIEATRYLLKYFQENYADLKLSKEVSEVSEYIYTRGKNEGIKEGKKAKELEIAAEMLKKGCRQFTFKLPVVIFLAATRHRCHALELLNH